MQKLSKAIKSSKPWSRDESMEILRSKFCALWRSWPPRRLDRSCSMASGSFGCSECCTLVVTRKCFELKEALKIAMHHRDLYGPFGAQQARTQKVTKEGSYPDDSWWFATCLTCFGSRLVYVYVDMFLLDHSGAALLPVEARKPTCAIPVVEISQILFMTSFSMLWYSLELQLFYIWLRDRSQIASGWCRWSWKNLAKMRRDVLILLFVHLAHVIAFSCLVHMFSIV